MALSFPRASVFAASGAHMASHMFTTVALIYGTVCCGFVLSILFPSRF